MEEGFGLGVGGDEVGEAEGGVVGGYFEGGEEVWDGGGVHVCFFEHCRRVFCLSVATKGAFFSRLSTGPIAGLMPPLNDDQDQVPPANGTRL